MRIIAPLIASLALAAPVGPSAAASPFRVTSPAFAANGPIPSAQSNYGANSSPALVWAPKPGAKSYVVILDDPDAPSARPFVHWLIWNIPASATGLPAGEPAVGRPAVPAGAVQGRNGADTVGYFGPRPPSGLHHYHFKVFALDILLALAPGSGRDALTSAMSGHVLAAGELVGTYTAP